MDTSVTSDHHQPVSPSPMAVDKMHSDTTAGKSCLDLLNNFVASLFHCSVI